MKNILLHLILIILPLSYTMSTHILSGNIGYECLGNGDYEITIELERDCYSNGADFDSQINVTIFRNGELYNNIEVNKGDVVEVFPEDYENCTPSEFEFCREKTNYTFSTNLERSDESYTISFQRCCWSGIIGNILQPEENGITITTDITPLSQSICNSQEISSAPISFLACPNENVSLTLPLIDVEGDSLVYDICLPFAGGGLEGSGLPGNPNGCMGITPIPACPPPYTELIYRPGFSDDNPFPTVDGLSFVDGVLSFTPTTIGHYLTALCISEYRNGELLSSKQVPLAVVADIEPNNIIDQDIIDWKLVNVSSNQLKLQTNKTAGATSFTIINVNGKIVKTSHKNNDNVILLDIAHLKSGLHILQIEDQNKAQSIKFIKP